MRPPLLATALTASVALLACGAGETIDQRACPAAGATLTYENFGQAFFAQWCESCHASASANRNGAPPNVTFDSRDEVVAWKGRIFARAADDNTSMPLGPHGPDTGTRHQLGDWLACGAK